MHSTPSSHHPPSSSPSANITSSNTTSSEDLRQFIPVSKYNNIIQHQRRKRLPVSKTNEPTCPPLQSPTHLAQQVKRPSSSSSASSSSSSSTAKPAKRLTTSTSSPPIVPLRSPAFPQSAHLRGTGYEERGIEARVGRACIVDVSSRKRGSSGTMGGRRPVHFQWHHYGAP